jgi:hypothetical protein
VLFSILYLILRGLLRLVPAEHTIPGALEADAARFLSEGRTVFWVGWKGRHAESLQWPTS